MINKNTRVLNSQKSRKREQLEDLLELIMKLIIETLSSSLGTYACMWMRKQLLIFSII